MRAGKLTRVQPIERKQTRHSKERGAQRASSPQQAHALPHQPGGRTDPIHTLHRHIGNQSVRRLLGHQSVEGLIQRLGRGPLSSIAGEPARHRGLVPSRANVVQQQVGRKGKQPAVGPHLDVTPGTERAIRTWLTKNRRADKTLDLKKLRSRIREQVRGAQGLTDGALQGVIDRWRILRGYKSPQESCYARLAETPKPESKKPLTNKNAAYTLSPSNVAKRFTGHDGTSWMVAVRFGRRVFRNRQEARRFVDAHAERAYRRILRGERNTLRQLCEQADPKPIADYERSKPRERKIEIDARVPGQSTKRSPPKIDNPIVVDGFPFNDWALPQAGRGREQLDRLRKLDPGQRASIKITSIEGHTDKIPMRRNPSKRFASLKELSNKRANEVRKVLKKAGFGSLPERNEPVAAREAVESRTASARERAKDRKVVVRWKA